jgi:hypothetical protein
MYHNLILAIGAVLWVGFALVAILHAMEGDPAGPLVAVIVVATFVAVRHGRRRLLRAS